jgi:putative transposase
MDNGPELIALRLKNWAEEHQIILAHIQPGKPAQNAYVERFNRTFREDVLDAYLFDSLSEVREITEQWLEEYNAIRPSGTKNGSLTAGGIGGGEFGWGTDHCGSGGCVESEWGNDQLLPIDGIAL